MIPSLLFEARRRCDSPYINHFISADTVVSSYANPQSLNRYGYVLNNPIRFNDPTGHVASCEIGEDCKESRQIDRLGMIGHLKLKIHKKFGITMSDENGKNWDVNNLSLVYSSLQNIDNALRGKLASLVGGATLWLKSQEGGGDYHGSTHLDGSGIEFYTRGSAMIRQINIYHEFGHLLDNVPGLKDVFTNAAKNDSGASWISGNKINPNALISTDINDPNYGHAQAIQGIITVGPSDEWADAFGNYVAGNIKLSEPAGASMYNFVNNALFPPPPVGT